jgi:hypothetical protein
MNFYVVPGATRDELEAVAERALNAVMAAHGAGEVANVALLFKEDSTTTTNNNNDNVNDANDAHDANDANDNSDDANDNDNNNDVVVCPDSRQDPCVFRLHEESLGACDENEQMWIPPGDAPPVDAYD